MEQQNPNNLFNVYLNSMDSLGNIINISNITGDVNEGGVVSLLIKNVSSTSSLFTGMSVSDDGTYINPGTTIAGIIGDQITLSQNTIAGVAAVGHTFSFSGNDRTDICRFDIGSVLSQAPNVEELENASSCLIKLKYLSIERTSAQFTTDGTSTIQIRMINQYPNNIESRPVAVGYKNVVSSNIIGIIATGNTSYTYSDLSTNPNDYVAIANPFKNQIEIRLTDQDGDLLGTGATRNKDWNMCLTIYIPPQVDILNKNMPSLNY